MSAADSELHLRGASRFVADMPVPRDTIHLAIVESPSAHGTLLDVERDAALAHPGVHAVLMAQDVPGANQIGGIVADEPLLAEHAVHYVGQPIALVCADSPASARAAARLVVPRIEPAPAILDASLARSRGELLVPTRTFACGDVDQALATAAHVFHGEVSIGAQEHLYLETQSALAHPTESGGVRVLSATQSPTAVQRTIARVLGVAMHRIEVEVPRLGGGFGGKEDQATSFACLAALAAHRLGRPARLVLRRDEDLRITGKRHPYRARYRLGLDADACIVAYDVDFTQDGGAAADLSPAILERTLFHASGAYRIPNARIHAASCRTHLPPNTAFRGFGAPQAFFVIEAALAEAARGLGLPRELLQRRNLLAEGDTFPFGQVATRCLAQRSFDALDASVDLSSRRARIDADNASSRWFKRGMAVMPVAFGISFTTTFLNQAAALVHVYEDGSVSVNSAAVEMGQGVSEKLRIVAANTLGVSGSRVHIESTDTRTVANASPTAASTGADLNGHAVRIACASIRARMVAFVAETRGLAESDVAVARDGFEWGERGERIPFADVAIAMVHARRSLSAHAHYATPGLAFDREAERGHPFQYHVYGAGLVEVRLDVLRGTFEVEAVRVVHDAGRSLEPDIDRGQIEGALMQGIGLVTCEEILHDEAGRLLTPDLARYKVPDAAAAPPCVEVALLDEPLPDGVMGSKAVGEPPLIYGLGAFFALVDAIRAARPDAPLAMCAPLTPERVLLALTDPAPR